MSNDFLSLLQPTVVGEAAIKDFCYPKIFPRRDKVADIL